MLSVINGNMANFPLIFLKFSQDLYGTPLKSREFPIKNHEKTHKKTREKTRENAYRNAHENAYGKAQGKAYDKVTVFAQQVRHYVKYKTYLSAIQRKP